ncbi:MAG: DMT family transporter [Clostridia bacterium]|nr:DMT family transporter [Clostridia bacterium]
MKNQKKAITYALITVVLWSTIGSAFKITLRYIAFADLLFYAVVVSFVFFLTAMAVTGRLKKMRYLRWQDIRLAAILGFLNPFLYYLVLIRAYELLPAQEAGTLNYIWPVVLVLLSVPLLHQRIGWVSMLAILISFAGTLVIATGGRLLSLHFSSGIGVLLAAGSAVFWSLYWIFNVRDKKEEIIKLFLNFSFGLLYVFIYLLLTKGFRLPDARGLAGSVYIGLFEMGITFVLWLKALQYCSTTAKISNLVFLSPFLSLIWIRYAVGETIMLSTIAGLALIVGGILLQRFSGRWE